ncbi:MAG: nitronate monooxygenase [Betaproteobacteria bacterium]|nr:nitronate monooxygenase [Betaproteobacteria bacterium]
MKTTNTWPENRFFELFPETQHPIVQGGMIWVSGGKLAAAVSNAGGLGLIGAGSMKPDLLQHHIRKAKSLTKKPFGVNVPLLYKDTQLQLQTALDEGVRIFFTSAGSPKSHTPWLKSCGATVVHVASTPELALKCQDAGVDAVVLEGFEAGGHNGRDELTTLVLLQQIRGKLNIPLIIAGGIGSGAAIAAALALGADAVQIGTMFAATEESSAHPNFKSAMLDAGNTSTFLRLKKLVPVRLLHNPFSENIRLAEDQCASAEHLSQILGKGRAKVGMLEGDLAEGELEIGQIVSNVRAVPTCQALIDELVADYQRARNRLCKS